MTKILFLQNIAYEYFGVMWLSTALKRAGHDCSILMEGYDKDVVKSAIKSDADIIAFSCTTGLHKWAFKISKELKEKTDKLILFGGPHPTYFPEMVDNPDIDIICLGEGEGAIVELADKLEKKQDITKISNLWVKKDGKLYKNEIRNLTENLDDLGKPDREIYYEKYDYLRNNPRKPFFASKGCPFNCTFCFNHAFMKLYKGKGKVVRRRTVKSVIDEIKEVKSKYPLGTVYFQDDTFILNPKWVKEFVKIYKKEIGLPFVCLIRADLANEEIIKDLKYGGCDQVFFGVESGNEFIRNKILKKGVTNKQIIYTAKLLRKYKIKLKTYNMLGLPGETLENAFETVHLNSKIKANYVWCSLLQPYPKTEIYDRLKKAGEIKFSPDDVTHSLFYSLFSDTKVTHKKEIINLQRLFFYAVKFPRLEPVIRRLIKFKPNKLFDALFWLGHAYVWTQSENLKFFESVRFGLKNVGIFSYSKKKKF